MRKRYRKTKLILIFLGVMTSVISIMVLFIQSKTFAQILKKIAYEHMPDDLGIEGNFKELEVKFLPPGLILKEPALSLKKNNFLNLPESTKLDAKSIDVTLQVFQLFTGTINVNAFVVEGATLKLNLSSDFLKKLEFPKKKNKNNLGFTWDSFVHFNFRSVSLIDSIIELKVKDEVDVQAFTKELTIGKFLVKNEPNYDLALNLKKILYEAKGQSQIIDQLQTSIEIAPQKVNVRNFSIQENEIALHLHGIINGNIINPKTLKSEMNYILKGPIQGLLEKAKKAHVDLKSVAFLNKTFGNITLEGQFESDLMNFTNTFETKVLVKLDQFKYGKWDIDSGEIKASWKSPQVIVDSINVVLSNGKCKIGPFKYDVSANDQDFQLKLHLENLDFRKAMGDFLDAVYPLHMEISGDSNLDIAYKKKSSFFAIQGDVDFDVENFSLDNQKANVKKELSVLLDVPHVHLRSQIAIDASGFKFKETTVTLPQTKLRAFGSVDEKTGYNIDVKGNVHLEDIKKISKFNIAGDGDLHWTIKGKLPNVVFSFNTELKNASYLDLNLGDAKGEIIWDDANDLLKFKNFQTIQGRTTLMTNGLINMKTDVPDLKVNVPTGTIQDFAEIFSRFIEKSVPWYPKELTGKVSGLVQVSGKTDLNELSVLGDLDLSNINLFHEMIRSGSMRAGYYKGGYVAQNVLLKKKNGFIKGNIKFEADDTLNFDFKSDGLTTLDFDQIMLFDVPYSAPMAIEAIGSGKIGTLNSRYNISLGEGRIKNLVVPPSAVSLKTTNGRWFAQLNALGGSATAELNLGWQRGSQSSFQAHAERLDFSPILIALNADLAEDSELLTELTGSTNLQFDSSDLAHLSGSIFFEKYRLQKKGLSLAMQKSVQVKIQNGDYSFDGFHLVGEKTDFYIKGKSSHGVMSYQLGGSLNLNIFELLVAQIASFTGQAQIQGEIFGKADQPELQVAVGIKDAFLRLESLEQPFENIKMSGNLKDSIFSIRELSAKFAGGQVSGDGTAEIFYYKVPAFNIQVQLDGPKIKAYPLAYARSVGKLSLTGDQLPYLVKGKVVVTEALVRENFNMNEGARSLRSSKFLPQKVYGTVNGDLQIFDLDVDVAAERGILVKNSLFDAELKANLKIVHSLESPKLLGNINVLHGKLLFKDNYFNVQSGNVHFNNPSVLDPEIDLTGQTEVKGYKILLVASGKVSDYKLTFDSQPPLSQNDIVSLLTIGVTSAGLRDISRDSREAYSRDELYSLVFSQTGINKGLQDKLGVKLRVDQSQLITPESAFRVRSNTDVNETVAPKVVLQKQVTKKLSASAGTTVGVGANKEQDVDLEYNINRNWSVIGAYEDQRGTQPRDSRTSIGADLKFQFKFK